VDLSSTCDPDQRSFILLARDICGIYPELESLGQERSWKSYPHLGAIRTELRGSQTREGVSGLVRQLRRLLDPPRLEALRGAWVQSEQALEEQLVELVHAEPLLQLAMGGASPLLEILNHRRIETWFQPIFRADSPGVWGYECLMRGRSTTGELISAGDLLTWAREDNLLFLLDHYCREMHITNAGKHDLGRECQLLVNFLPNSIHSPAFSLQAAMEAARQSGLSPDQIIFEVVETDQIRDRDSLRRILARYREYGFKVALDDVGSGYSGLALMGDLNPDLIKIDRELVRKSVGSAWHRGICESLVNLGKTNGRLVLAEGVETEAERQVMEAMGADLFQGYLFGRPSPEPARTSARAA
jgi:EAL domain-containing protein (putative c-di-GMP-specific phosphodiesterase class I)